MTHNSQNRHQQQTGCITGMFQIFDHRHFRRNSTKQLPGAEHRLNSSKAARAATENNLETQEKSSAGAETPAPRKINVSENTSRIQDAVKNSMHRQGRGSSTIIKHVDSPRPLPQANLEKVKALAYEGSVYVRTLPKESRDNAEDEKLPHPRFSFDGKESKGTFTNTLKLKEFPRLSLDSKVGATRSNFLGQEPESRTPSSPSIVTKLMGLDPFPETESSPRPKPASPSKSLKRSAVSKEGHVHFSTPISNNKQASVYGEIEKGITKLEFNRDGIDLQAIKQILGAINNSKERLESQNSAELAMQKNCSLEETYHYAPIVEVIHCSKTESTKGMSSTSVRTMEISDMQRVRIRGPKCQREDREYRRPAKDLKPRTNNVKEHGQILHSNEKKTQSLRMLNCTPLEKGSRMVSPKLHIRVGEEHHLTAPSSSQSGRIRKHSSKNGKERCSLNRKQATKQMDIHLSENQLNVLRREIRRPNCQGCIGSLNSESNINLGSSTEADVTNSVKFTNPREQRATKTAEECKPGAELMVNIMEQPSPVSVLDSPVYNEGSPSPVRKTTTAFQVGSPITDEAECQIEDPNQLIDCTGSYCGFNCSQLSTHMLYQNQEPQSLNINPMEPAANDKELLYARMLASGLPKDTSIMQTPDLLNSSSYTITPSLFNTIKRSEVPAEEVNSEIAERHGWGKFNQKIKKRLVLDLLHEILVRRNKLGGLSSVGRRRWMGPNELLKEEYLEMDCLCRMSSCNLDDRDDGLIRLLISEIKYLSDDWTTYSSEVPGLVLDIERLIFKDLINEVVTGEVMVNNDFLRRRRQLRFAN